MRKPILALIYISLSMSSCHAQQRGGAFEPVAVIELFTSEGCSSCPPADRLFARYAHLSSYNGIKLFPLAFHVDYWNYLGWKDSFSSAVYSDRQRMYVDALGLSGAYTPQMIVNGKDQFVGSDESALKDALSVAAQNKNRAKFTDLTMSYSSGQLKVKYALEGDIKDSRINFALVSLEVSTSVKRGENAGRKLVHTNVVRRFLSQRAETSGEIIFQNTSSLVPDNTAVIAYIQHDADKQILAAAQVN